MIYGLPHMMSVLRNLSKVVSTLLRQLQRLPDIIARTVTVFLNLSEMMMPAVLLNLSEMMMPTVLLSFPNMVTVVLRQPQRLPEMLRQPQRLSKIIAKTGTVLVNLSVMLPTVLHSFPELLTLFLGPSMPCTQGFQNA